MSDESSGTAADVDVQATLNRLYHTVLREVEDETALTEVDADMYRNISEFIGDLGRQEYAGIENKVKERVMATVTELVSLLLHTRLEKVARLKDAPDAKSATVSMMQKLIDEEKFVMDADEERDERLDVILSATKNGRTRLLESISESHKTDRTMIRFIKDTEQMVGADMELYGPFRTEDVAAIPHENAQALVSEKSAVRVRWEDYRGRL